MKRFIYIVVTILVTTCFFSCATIMNGPKQEVGIASNPSGAKITVDGDSLGITPLIVNLARKDTHLVRIDADGFEPYITTITKVTSVLVLGNLFLAPPIGTIAGFGVDYVSGGLYELVPKWLRFRLADGSVAYEFNESDWTVPPLNEGKIAGEILAGVAGGIIVFNGILSRDSGSGLGYFAMVCGSTIGSTLGVYLLGNTGNENGSFGSTAVGSFLGLVGSLGLILLLNEDTVANIGIYIPFCCTSIGATIGFNMTRIYRTLPSETEIGLLNLQHGQMSLAVPQMYLHPNPFIRGDKVQTVDLISVRF